MALTGLEIFKQLPKTNCRDCGLPTCLAFAMAVASGKALWQLCPHLSEEAKETLDAASAPPIALVRIGTGSQEFVTGDEKVLFRHDKRFEHPTGIAVAVSDAEDIAAKAAQIKKLVFERVGQLCGVDLVALSHNCGDGARFAEAALEVTERTCRPLILITEEPAAAELALEATAGQRPLLASATEENYREMVCLAQKYDLPLVVKSDGLSGLAALVEKITVLGHRQLVLDSGAREANQVLVDQTQIRRQALKRFRPFGYPTVAYANGQDSFQTVLEAGLYIAKYAGIVVLPTVDPADILALLTLRLNIYTDPQKPAAVKPGIYEIGVPGPQAPVYVTTNFSLTHFCVAGDVEATRVPAYILSVDTDGVSVLTGWAAGKFTAEKIAKALLDSGIVDRVKHRKVIIPGGVAVLSSKLQALSGWEVLVGPNDSAAIPSFIKQHWEGKENKE